MATHYKKICIQHHKIKHMILIWLTQSHTDKVYSRKHKEINGQINTDHCRPMCSPQQIHNYLLQNKK